MTVGESSSSSSPMYWFYMLTSFDLCHIKQSYLCPCIDIVQWIQMKRRLWGFSADFSSGRIFETVYIHSEGLVVLFTLWVVLIKRASVGFMRCGLVTVTVTATHSTVVNVCADRYQLSDWSEAQARDESPDHHHVSSSLFHFKMICVWVQSSWNASSHRILLTVWIKGATCRV